MKRSILNGCALTALFAALSCGTSCTHVECDAAQAPSAAEILGYPEGSGQELVYSTGFENPAEPEIKLGEGFRFAPGEGNNGNGGLRGERLDTGLHEGRLEDDLRRRRLAEARSRRMTPWRGAHPATGETISLFEIMVDLL